MQSGWFAFDAAMPPAGDLAQACFHEDELIKRYFGPRPEQWVPPQPVETVYNAGTAQYELPAYHNNGLPRPCRAGSGRPSYSTRRRPAQPGHVVPPPVAGAHLEVPTPAPAFVEARRVGSGCGGLPVLLSAQNGGRTMGVRWLTPVEEVDARRWLPVLLEGMREADPTHRFLAIQASVELMQAAGQSGVLLPLLPALVPALRAALYTKQRPVVCAALKLLQHALSSHPSAGRALRPHYKALVPPMKPFVLSGQPSLGDAFEFADYRQVNVADLTQQTLLLMERCGGPGASAVIKQLVPTYEPDDQDLHRGFRK